MGSIKKIENREATDRTRRTISLNDAKLESLLANACDRRAVYPRTLVSQNEWHLFLHGSCKESVGPVAKCDEKNRTGIVPPFDPPESNVAAS